MEAIGGASAPERAAQLFRGSLQPCGLFSSDVGLLTDDASSSTAKGGPLRDGLVGEQLLSEVLAENRQTQEFLRFWEHQLESKLDHILRLMVQRQDFENQVCETTKQEQRHHCGIKSEGEASSELRELTLQQLAHLEGIRRFLGGTAATAPESIEIVLQRCLEEDRARAGAAGTPERQPGHLPRELLEDLPARVSEAVQVLLEHSFEEHRAHEKDEDAKKAEQELEPIPLQISSLYDAISVGDEGRDQCVQEIGTSKSSFLNGVGPTKSSKSAKDRAAHMTRLFSEGKDMSIVFSEMERKHDKPKGYGKKTWLDIVSMALIFSNTLYMAFEAEVRMRSAVEKAAPPDWLIWCELFFPIAFGLELIAKVVILRHDFYRKNLGWNLFDAFLVFSSVADIVFEVLNISFLRGLRIIRAVRVARALRTIRHVEQLRLMVASIISSLPSLGWAFVLLMLLLYLFALLIMQGAEDHIRYHGLDEEILEQYGNLTRSVLTLFMAISGGKDWADCVQPLRQVSGFYVFLFVCFVTFVVFGVVNILTAVFIEASSGIIDIDRDLVVQRHRAERDSVLKHLQGMLEGAGIGKTGRISRGEISALIDKEETVALLKTLGVEVDHAHDLFKLLQLDAQEDEVDIGEFVVALLRVRGPAKGMDVAKTMQEFSLVREEINRLSKQFEVLSTARQGVRYRL